MPGVLVLHVAKSRSWQDCRSSSNFYVLPLTALDSSTHSASHVTKASGSISLVSRPLEWQTWREVRFTLVQCFHWARDPLVRYGHAKDPVHLGSVGGPVARKLMEGISRKIQPQQTRHCSLNDQWLYEKTPQCNCLEKATTTAWKRAGSLSTFSSGMSTE